MQKLVYIFLTTSITCFADLTIKDGKLVEKETVATESVHEHYSAILKAHQEKAWKNLEKEANIVIKNFSTSPFGRDATYFLALAYFYQEEYDMANLKLTNYLTHEATPRFFEDAIRYKFEIAEHFRNGARKHLMGFKSMPKWAPAGEDAIAIYDEVISALPHSDLAAQSLFGKAQVQAKREDYRAAIESYQTVIRRFSKHPLAVESYIGIGQIYLVQSETEYPDPDFLDLAELNLRKFRASFPGEEKIQVAVSNLEKMEEHYASSLFETASFYERTKKLGAAKIYYTKIVASFPKSQIAKKSQDRLETLEVKLAKIEAKKNKSD